jgi:hypothetical protein
VRILVFSRSCNEGRVVYVTLLCFHVKKVTPRYVTLVTVHSSFLNIIDSEFSLENEVIKPYFPGQSVGKFRTNVAAVAGSCDGAFN